MKQNRRIMTYTIYILLGVALWGLGFAGVVGEFWSGMGSAFVLIGVLRLVRMYRFCKDENYREMVEIKMADERNRFIRNKAWAWAGYLFILIAGSSVVVLRVMGHDMLSLAASFAVCLMLILYWGAYLVFRKKY